MIYLLLFSADMVWAESGTDRVWLRRDAGLPRRRGLGCTRPRCAPARPHTGYELLRHFGPAR